MIIHYFLSKLKTQQSRFLIFLPSFYCLKYYFQNIFWFRKIIFLEHKEKMSSEEGERSISRVRDRSRSYSRKHVSNLSIEDEI